MVAWQDELQSVIDGWAGTPYLAGSCMRRRGVDCVRFVDAVLNELHGHGLPPVSAAVGVGSTHDRRNVVRAYRELAGRYRHRLVDRDEMPEPGDVLVTTRDGFPGHVMIAGRQRGVLWDADVGIGVGRVGWGGVRGEVLRHWRLEERLTWLSHRSRSLSRRSSASPSAPP
jgi:hypothetical protein